MVMIVPLSLWFILASNDMGLTRVIETRLGLAGIISLYAGIGGGLFLHVMLYRDGIPPNTMLGRVLTAVSAAYFIGWAAFVGFSTALLLFILMTVSWG